MNSCTSTLSNCGNYSISRICLPDIYQGDSAILELTLLDRLGIPVDLNTLNSIIILLYGIDESYKLIYEWPDITSTNNITLLQRKLFNFLVGHAFVYLDKQEVHEISINNLKNRL
jgi:hypothetical protein